MLKFLIILPLELLLYVETNEVHSDLSLVFPNENEHLLRCCISAAKFGVVFRLRRRTAVVASGERVKPTYATLSTAEQGRSVSIARASLCVVVTSSSCLYRLAGFISFSRLEEVVKSSQTLDFLVLFF